MPRCGAGNRGVRRGRRASALLGTVGVHRISPHLPVLLGCLLAVVALLPGACRTAPTAQTVPGDPSPWAAARARGVDFRATGNEPGWFLELDDGVQIVLVTDYGRRRYEMPAPEPQVDEAARRVTFRTASTLAGGRGNRLVLTLAPGPCEDTMSGETFDTTVTVTIDGETLHGCGRALN